LTVSYLIILGIIATISIGFAFADPTEAVITVQMNGPSTFYLDSTNQIIRAIVEIQNYSPSDGIYFMKVTHLTTQKVMRDFDIYPKPSGNDLWSVQIAYPFLESDLKIGDQAFLGEFEIHIRTEFGFQTASTKFSIFESQDESEPVSEVKPQVEPETQTQIDPPSLETDVGPSNEPTQKIPEWVRTVFVWYAQEQVSEVELLNAIKYLVQQDIIKID